MSWHDIGKPRVPTGYSLQYEAWLVALVWIKYAHALAVQVVLPMAPTSALPLAVIGDGMPAMDGQACPFCPRRPMSVLSRLALSNLVHKEIQKRPLASSGVFGKFAQAHIDRINDRPDLSTQIRFCRWHR